MAGCNEKNCTCPSWTVSTMASAANASTPTERAEIRLSVSKSKNRRSQRIIAYYIDVDSIIC